MAVKGAGKNRYYKKVSGNNNTYYDVNLSTAFGDLFDGNSETSKIKGGVDEQLYISDIVIPDKSVYDGGATLVGLKQYYFPTEVSLDKKESLPTFNLWKSNTHIGPDNEGTITTVNKRDITIISATNDIEQPWLTEDFSGAFSRVTAISGEKIIEYGNPYLTIDAAHRAQSADFFPMTHQQLKKRYAEEITPGQWVIFVEKKKLLRRGQINPWSDSGSWVPRDGRRVDKRDIWFQYLQDGDLQYTNTIKVTADVEETIDASDTIATNIYTRGSKNMTDEADVDLFRSTVTVSGDKSLTGGQSLKSRTKWATEAIPGTTKTGQTIPDEFGYYGATNRQENVSIFEVPMPLPIDTSGSETLRDDDLPPGSKENPNYHNWYDGSLGYTNQVISTDFLIENLSPVFRAKSDAHDTHNALDYTGVRDCAILRGFAIMFSATKPLPNENFHAFMVRTGSPLGAGLLKRTTNATNDANEYGSTAGVIIAKWPIDFGSLTDRYVAKKNVDRDFIGNSPIMVTPTQAINDSYNEATLNPFQSGEDGFWTGNLNNKTDSDGACFHETLGPTVWMNLDSHFDAQHNFGAQIEENIWIYIVFKFYARAIMFQLRNSQTQEPLSKWMTCRCRESTPFMTDWRAPRYMSIWNFNYPGKANYTTDPDDYAFRSTNNFDTENVIYFDNIQYHGFNNLMTNATVTENNTGLSTINIESNKSYIYADDEINDIDDPKNPTFYNNNYISLGFDDPAEFDKLASGGTTNLWFSNIGYNSSTVDDIYHTSTDIAIRAGFTSNAWDERIGCQASHSFFTYESGSPANVAAGWPYVNKGLSTYGAVANRGFDFKGTSQIELFSNKGGLIFDFNSSTVNLGNDLDGAQCIPAKRENIFASSRVLDISDAKEGWLKVDNPTVINLPDDTEYVIYKFGRAAIDAVAFTETFYQDYTTYPTNKFGKIVKVIERNGDMIKFDDDLTKAQNGTTDLCTEEFYHRLFISPLKYWVVLEVRNTSATEGIPGISRTYGSITSINQGLSLPDSTSYGATFNETKFTDAGTYLKRRNLNPDPENSSIETQTDYGNGTMSDDNQSGGYITQVVVEDNLDDLKKWLVFDSSPIIDEDKLKEGDVLTTVLASANPLNSSSMTIATSENDDKIVSTGHINTKKPFALAIYEDRLPTVSDFNVFPSESNPFYPEFRWKCADEDAWYGFLIIDTEPPTDQYHKSSLHVPMWRPLPSTENTFMNWPPSTDDSEGDVIDYFNNKTYQYGYTRLDKLSSPAAFNPSSTTTKGTHAGGSINDYTKFLDPEGLSGWCHNFRSSVNDRIYLFRPGSSGSNDASGSINSAQSSYVIHIRPDKYPDIDCGILETGGWKGGVDIAMNSDGKIIARFYYSKLVADSYVELTSHSVAPLNGIPTNIIVTFDKDLTHGNCKLLMNGKLEDQSGKVLAAGSTTRWKTGANIVGSYDDGGVGWVWHLGSSSGWNESYDGNMEEFVYYPHTIYPINPADGTFVWTKPVSDIDSDGKPISYYARLFVKDYHNIRGTSIDEVASSTTVTIHKAGVEL